MKFSASTVLLAAALGVSAHPHGAAHPHARRDTNLDVRDTFYRNAKPSTATVFQTVTVNAVNAAAAPTTTSTSAAAAATSNAATSSSSSSGTIGSSGSYKDDFDCSSNSKRATLEEIKDPGNTGSPKYGCNMKLVEQSAAKNYQYISVLENVASQKQVCACFMKIDSNGDVAGSWKGHEVLDFELATGESKYLAVQAGTIGMCTCGAGSLPTTKWGQLAGEWLEFEYGSIRNTGFSGADASSLVAESDNQTLQGLTVTEESQSSKVSVIYPNGDGCNAFPKGTEYEDGHGFNIGNTQKGGNAVRVHAKWGTTGSLGDCPDASWKQTRK